MFSGWGTNWIGNLVTGNQVSDSPIFAIFYYAGINGTPPLTAITFENNTFSGNAFQAQILPWASDALGPYSVIIDFSGVSRGSRPLPLPFTGGNNVFSNNTFVNGFFVLPAMLVTDGGGNTCGASACISSVGRTLAVGHAAPPSHPRIPPMPHHTPVRVIRRSEVP
jgi:hypothetical protein